MPDAVVSFTFPIPETEMDHLVAVVPDNGIFYRDEMNTRIDFVKTRTLRTILIPYLTSLLPLIIPDPDAYAISLTVIDNSDQVRLDIFKPVQ